MPVIDEIRTRLDAAFDPRALDVRDDSAQHAGHSGAPAGGESHFSVTIRADAFGEMSRLQRHRAIHAALGPELVARIHALALDVDG
ncbi:BolA family transcriptional regulator [Maribius pontilimi]|uniref:BolA family transcriptional regulator n=1 Tax=Palleronia pontilimi TaxID=1964209 RepID=A0A934IG35_9RHOB|nr:BolA family protein [Palleronia pontilimi]MBJ3762790.1 BolA family transcriptional regulator [Palleronia pontilimi]